MNNRILFPFIVLCLIWGSTWSFIKISLATPSKGIWTSITPPLGSSLPKEITISSVLAIDTHPTLKAVPPIKTQVIALVQNVDCFNTTSWLDSFWKIFKNERVVGKVTSAVYSPRLRKNIALALIDVNYSDLGNSVDVEIDKSNFDSTLVEVPFYDPKKKLVKIWVKY